MTTLIVRTVELKATLAIRVNVGLPIQLVYRLVGPKFWSTRLTHVIVEVDGTRFGVGSAVRHAYSLLIRGSIGHAGGVGVVVASIGFQCRMKAVAQFDIFAAIVFRPGTIIFHFVTLYNSLEALKVEF
jgi:hypothetical protein